MEITFLGFGLIGGSMARAVRSQPAGPWTDVRLTAWSPTGDGPRQAATDGILDRVASSPAEAVRGADVVVIAAPPLATASLLEILADRSAVRLGETTIVTDVASTKRMIVERARTLELPFVGGHPMAGLESTGYRSAQADLFVDRPWVVVPFEADDPRAALVDDLARSVGARPVRMGAVAHDQAVAAISHLPLVLAAALVEAVAGTDPATMPEGWPVARQLAAGGWRDMTRLARGDATMAAGIAATNAAALAARIREIRQVLESWLEELEGTAGPDAARLALRFESVRRRLDDPGA